MRIHLSAACSIDGYMDAASDARLVLSSPEDLLDIQRERAQSDAIFVGAETIRADNPRLTVREPPLIAQRIRRGLPPQPIKVTVTTTGNLDPNAHFFRQGAQETIVLCPSATTADLQSCYAGLACVIGLDGPICARGIANVLQRRGVRHRFVEGGTRVLSMFVSEAVFDRFRLAIVPCFVGRVGASRLQLWHDRMWDPSFRLVAARVRLLGGTTVVDYEFVRGDQAARARHGSVGCDRSMIDR
ncbi:RibD family protein [Ralstonia solanacearum]|uniref:RibD family protein n=1 Tax=Ralstonia solanacearum TaxID=305 RepID=UPI000BE780AA|nr:RibD family protein [Ralstonia solanacearum]ATJ88899.1 pyrimidine reductase [Ralstonia solanacearum]